MLRALTHGMSLDPYAITDACTDACDTACVDVCPVDCIYGLHPLDELRAIPEKERVARALRLYINPDECIGCGACEPECPIGAISPAAELEDGDAQLAKARAFFASDF